MFTSVLPGFREALVERWSGRVLSDAQIAALEAHCALMLRWNRSLNLTTITRLDEVVERHYLESMAVAEALPAGRLHVVDVGSGAGFPGVPVSIMRPECSVTLVESHQRKAVFLKEATRTFGNLRVLGRRAEDVGETFDWLISRAVSHEDVGKVLPKLAAHALLLTGEERPALSGYRWEEVRRLSGKSRFLWRGELV